MGLAMFIREELSEVLHALFRINDLLRNQGRLSFVCVVPYLQPNQCFLVLPRDVDMVISVPGWTDDIAPLSRLGGLAKSFRKCRIIKLVMSDLYAIQNLFAMQVSEQLFPLGPGKEGLSAWGDRRLMSSTGLDHAFFCHHAAPPAIAGLGQLAACISPVHHKRAETSVYRALLDWADEGVRPYVSDY